jgi:hypothetical protein
LKTANYSRKFVPNPYRSRPTGEARRTTLQRRRRGPSFGWGALWAQDKPGRASYPGHLTEEQRAWLARFQTVTGQNIHHIEALKEGAMTFDYVAKVNIQRYEQLTREVINAITRDIPYTED